MPVPMKPAVCPFSPITPAGFAGTGGRLASLPAGSSHAPKAMASVPAAARVAAGRRAATPDPSRRLHLLRPRTLPND